MNITKSIITFLLFIPYIYCIGMFSFGVTFPDKTKIYYDGWMF